MGAVPCPTLQPVRPLGGPGPSTPHLTQLTLQETGHRRICFLGQSAPLGAPCSPEAQMPRPCSCDGQATPPGGWGRCGHTKGPLWSSPEPAAWHAHTQEGHGKRGSGALASGEGADV